MSRPAGVARCFVLIAIAVLTCAATAGAQEDIRDREAPPTAPPFGPKPFRLQPFDPSALVFEGDNWKLRIGGRLALEGVKYGHANDKSSGAEVEAITMRIEGHYGDRLTWRIEPDFVGDDSRRNLFEAAAAYEFDPGFRVRAGQFRVALSSEYATRNERLPFVGYGFPAYLGGRYDIGVGIDGELGEGFYYEAIGVVGAGYDLEGETQDSPQISLRTVLHPHILIGSPGPDFLDSVFGGIAIAYRTDPDDSIVVTTPTESTVFRSRDIDGEDAQFLHFEGGATFGPVLIGAERIVGAVNEVEVPGGGEEDLDELTSWSAYTAINLTGEDQEWERGRWTAVAPSAAEDRCGPVSSLFQWVPGRLELAARYSNADIDRDLFDFGFTTYDPSTQEVRTFSAELNWYDDGNTRVGVGYVRTIADDELSTFGGNNRDSTYFFRLDLIF